MRPDSPNVSALIQQSLAENRHVYLSVSSNSMAPIFCEGDEIKITKVNVTELKPGKILALTKNDTYLAHRLLQVIHKGGKTLLITKGDRLRTADQPHPLADILGLVVARRRKGKILEFESGKGLWPARAIARLSIFEARLMIRSGSEGNFQIMDGVAGPGGYRLYHRILRWLTYRFALILLKIIESFP